MREKIYKKVIIIDGDENVDWILGAIDSPERLKEIKLIESLVKI